LKPRLKNQNDECRRKNRATTQRRGRQQPARAALPLVTAAANIGELEMTWPATEPAAAVTA
jgi:hypothetical protein